MFYMQERLGAWQVGDDRERGAVAFGVFFPPGFDPHVSSIQAYGDFQAALPGGAAWDPATALPLYRTEQAEGTFWRGRTEAELPAGFYEYKYRVTFDDGSTRIVSDPLTRYGGSEYQNAAFVIGGSRPADNLVAPLAGGRRPLRDLTVYELHIDDFTDEFRAARAPLDALRDKLDYLVDLGIDAILCMPWTAWKHHGFDWGYEPFQYFSVEYRYANDLSAPAEKIAWLKRLVSACHERGIHVIMDGVFNHVSYDFPYKQLYLNPDDCPYTGTFGGTFPGLQDLDFDNVCTQELIRDVCLYWIDEFGIDGIRFDNTVNYHRDSDSRGIPQLLEDIQAHLDANGEAHFSLTLEHLSLEAADLTNHTRATSYWDNSLYQQTFQSLWDGRLSPGLLDALNHDRFLASAEKTATVYLGNHDHSQLAWRAGARSNRGSMDWYRTQPYVIALLMATGTPMIQGGQEFGEDHWLPENDENTGRRVRPRPLRWKLAEDRIGRSLLGLYRRLLALRHDYPALRSRNFYPDHWEPWQTRFNAAGFGVDSERQLMIFHRWGLDASGRWQRFYLVLNFSPWIQPATLHLPRNGPWSDMLNDETHEAQDFRLELGVPSHWGHIFFQTE